MYDRSGDGTGSSHHHIRLLFQLTGVLHLTNSFGDYVNFLISIVQTNQSLHFKFLLKRTKKSHKDQFNNIISRTSTQDEKN